MGEGRGIYSVAMFQNSPEGQRPSGEFFVTGRWARTHSSGTCQWQVPSPSAHTGGNHYFCQRQKCKSIPVTGTKNRQAPSGACRFLFPHPVGADYISARWQPQLRRCLRGRICNAPLHQCRWCTAPCRGGYQPPANLPGRAMRAPTWCTANSHRARRPLPASFFALASNVCS